LPALGAGTEADLRWVDLGADVVAFSRKPGFTCVVNVSTGTVPLPWGEVLLASDPMPGGEELPPDAAVWLRTP